MPSYWIYQSRATTSCTTTYFGLNSISKIIEDSKKKKNTTWDFVLTVSKKQGRTAIAHEEFSVAAATLAKTRKHRNSKTVGMQSVNSCSLVCHWIKGLKSLASMVASFRHPRAWSIYRLLLALKKIDHCCDDTQRTRVDATWPPIACVQAFE